MSVVGTLRNRWRLLALLIACGAGMIVGVTQSGVSVDRILKGIDWKLREHAANGSLHIVEIDARSLSAIDRWPLPRRNYVAVIDRLRAAGARSIVFDVDFSSRSAPADDALFAAALERANGKVVLATFRQQAGSGQAGWTDALPIPALRPYVSLAAVSIMPDADGYVRRAPLGTVTADLPRPSLSAIIAGVNGSADADFPIDFSIGPASIPRHSFVDVREGRFNPSDIAGKDVLIGATAVEMGDRYAVPNRGVIPGVVIQALAAQTLARGIPREAGWQIPLAIATILASLILAVRSRTGLVGAVAGSVGAIWAASIGADALLAWQFPVAPALTVVAVASGVALAMRLVAAARRRRAHDGETGLPNRLALRDALRLPEAAGGVVAARFAEFDKLAAALGTAGTIELVCRVRDRIQRIAQDTVYRVEDRVLAWRCSDREGLEEQIAALRTAMLSPVEVAGRRVDVSLSFGFAALNPDEQADAVANATLAAGQALAAGIPFHVHDAGDIEAIDRELSLLGELDEAIDKGEIHVLYQPKLDLKTGRIASVEALVRWQHGTRGWLRPDLFIPLAEQNDRIAGLTFHVLKQTIADLLAWQEKGHRITGAVNLSAKLLSSAAFIADLRRLVDTSLLDPQSLAFEVTESAAMHDPEMAAEALTSFRDIGIAISMDDYGTGQSTLSYIKQLPLNELKIDRSFVQFAHQNRSDGVLVRSTVNLAHELGLKVVAEGVEDPECLAFLKTIGCDMVQGYLISKPVSADELEQLLGRSYAEAA